MALPRFPRPKSFHVDYCGCTAAPFLMNESSVQDAIIATRLTKSKRDFIKATVSTAKDGVKIVYENKEKYSTHVPAIMIACATVGKASFQDTVGKLFVDSCFKLISMTVDIFFSTRCCLYISSNWSALSSIHSYLSL